MNTFFNKILVLSVLASLFALITPLRAQCPGFTGEFALPGGLPGADYTLVHDEGNGPALYLAGSFTNFDNTGLSYIARWDGSTLQGLGAGLDGPVFAMGSFDDGSGPALIVSGGFTHAGGQPAQNIAKWDGANWSPLGPGLDGSAVSMAQYDDGSGTALFVGGNFVTSGSQSIFRLAKWQNGQWSQFGGGTLDPPESMAVFDDGTGPALYMAGSFTKIGPLLSCNGFAKMQGTTWTSLIGGTKNGTVRSMIPFDDGSGPSFFLGGSFTTYNGVSAPGIVRWRNGVLSAVSFGFQHTPNPSLLGVYSLTTFDDGAGLKLYAAGRFDRSGPTLLPSVARWNGSFFEALGAGLTLSVSTIAAFDDGGGPALWAGGAIYASGTVPMTGTVTWRAGAWSTLTPGNGLNEEVDALRELDGPGGKALVVAGRFTGTGSLANANRIASWNGTNWVSLAGGLDATPAAVEAFDAGAGPRIAAGGSFTTVNFQSAFRIAQWDGTTWSAMGSGFNGNVNALGSFDSDGTGPQAPQLIAAGAFGFSGAVLMREISAWNGSAWTPLAQGLTDGSTNALRTVVLSSGAQRLYAGGSFNIAGAVPAHGLAVWNGTNWAKVGGDVTGTVQAIASLDTGSPAGPSIVIGGFFSAVNGVSATNVALWNGTVWSALGSGLPSSVEALEVFDDGTGAGPSIYAGGPFTVAGGAPASFLVRWDGASWVGVGSGVDARVRALARYDDGLLGRPGLFFGGNFLNAGGRSSARIAHLAPCSFHTFCTAKVNSQGCAPAMELSGVPSATALSGFTVMTRDVLNNKPGLLLYGFTGKANVAFQGGTLCVAPPLARSVGILSGGNPPPNDCSGVFTIDMNAFAHGALGGNPKPALQVVGSIVTCQMWSRDPGFPVPDNSSLSNAAEYTIGF